MQKIIKINKLRKELSQLRKENKTIGLVPTMGYLHEGHLSLIDQARKDNDIVVVSIFVNPTQFGPHEDLETYPRDLERDAKLAENHGADIIFNPSVDEMYDQAYSTYVEVEGYITNRLCGASREGHFKGVTSVVTKLFNIVNPDRAYFGQKDYQQLTVIRKMVRDLNFDIAIVACPIVREEDGLAMSSRNTYLTAEQRKDATKLYKALKMAKDLINNGENDPENVKKKILDKLNEIPYAVIDYVEIVDAKTLKDIEMIEDDVVIALAVEVGKPRLIDNILVEVD